MMAWCQSHISEFMLIMTIPALYAVVDAVLRDRRGVDDD